MLTGPPTTHAERKQVTAAWRAVPLRQRVAVARSAKAGVRHPDDAAASAAEAYARLVERPRGRRWWRRLSLTTYAWVNAALAVVLGLLAVLYLRVAWLPDPMGWFAMVAAVLALLGAIYTRDLVIGSRTLLSTSRAEVTGTSTGTSSPGWAGTTG